MPSSPQYAPCAQSQSVWPQRRVWRSLFWKLVQRRLIEAAVLAGVAALTGCASAPGKTPASTKPSPVAAPKPVRAIGSASPAVVVRPGPSPAGEVDGPALTPAPDPASVPDAEPVLEPVRISGPNKPYEALGRSYVPNTEDKVYAERGLASWYGRKFHGRRTASGEPFDMHAMTAAHPTLPLPSYVRVRNPANGNEVLVRINDRGPFHRGRIIDLSYTAAQKLDLLRGVGTVEIARITQEEIRTGSWRRSGPSNDPADAAVDRQMAQRRDAPMLVAKASPIPARPVASTAVSTAAPAAASLLVTPAAAPSLGTPSVSLAAAPSPVTPAAPPLVATTGRDTVRDATLPSTPPAGSAAESSGALAVDTVAFVSTLVLPGAAASPVAAPPAAPMLHGASPPPGFWVQLGAFRLRDGADLFQRRVVADLAWLKPLLSVLSESELHRLQAGPYLTRDEANGVAQRVREALSLVPLIVERH